MKKILTLTALLLLSNTTFAQEVNYKGSAKCPEYWHMGEGSCQINFNGQVVYASGRRGSANWSACKKISQDTYQCDQANSGSRNLAVIVKLGKNPSIRGVSEKL